MGAYKTVKKSRKEHTCHICNDRIPVGEPYGYIAHKFAPKIIRCKKHPHPRPSELALGAKMQQLLAIGEGLSDDYERFKGGSMTVQDFGGCVESAVNDLESLCDEYDESISNIEEYFPDSPRAEEMQERRDEIEEWKENLQSCADDLQGLERPYRTNIKPTKEKTVEEIFKDELKDYIEERRNAIDEFESEFENQP